MGILGGPNGEMAMRRVLSVLVLTITGLLWAGNLQASETVEILYEANQLTGDRWEYTYTVKNNSTDIDPLDIEEFSIYFAPTLYADLAVTTPAPLSSDWDELVIQPETTLPVDDGMYDALALAGGIGWGTEAAGFSVSFDWIGTGDPGSQAFEVVDPSDPSIVLFGGVTTPEPCSVFLLATAGILFGRRRPMNRLRV